MFLDKFVLNINKIWFQIKHALGVEPQVLQQHGGREDRGHRVGDVLPRSLRIGAVDRLEKGHLGADARRREHAQRTADDAGLVGEDVAEHVLGDDHVEMGRLAYDLHRGVVHEHEFQLHFGVPGRHILRDLPPQARGFEHVGLVHDRQAPLAAHGEPECDVQHTFDLRARVGAGVESLRPGFVAPLRSAEIDAARQFAHADEIGAAHHLCLERRAAGQRVEQCDGAQVGEQSQRFAHAQQSLLGTYRGLGVVVVLGVADGTEQYGVGSLADGVRLVGIGVARGVDGAGAH